MENFDGIENGMVGFWATLPHVVLIQVFNYLDVGDRESASRVCRCWKAAYSDPSVWKNVVHYMDGPAFRFQSAVSEFGRYFGRLELLWNQYRPGRPAPTTDAPYHALNALIANRVQVKSLTLADWSSSYKWPNRNKIILILSKFLRIQERMYSLSFRNTSMRQNEVFHLLGSAVCGAVEDLRCLELKHAFREWQEPHSHPRYLTFLSNSTSLESLTIDYHAISEEVLEIMCARTPKLRKLRVTIHAFDIRHPPIENVFWAKLRKTLQNLQVHFDITNMGYHRQLMYFLKPSIPLRSLHLHSGKTWDQDEVRNFRWTLAHIIDSYSLTLEDISIDLKNGLEIMDDLIIELIMKCTQLRRFHYNGIVGSMEMVAELLEVIKSRTKNPFKYIDFAPRFVNFNNRQIIYDIIRQNEVAFLNEGVEFIVVEPPTVLLFF